MRDSLGSECIMIRLVMHVADVTDNQSIKEPGLGPKERVAVSISKILLLANKDAQ